MVLGWGNGVVCIGRGQGSFVVVMSTRSLGKFFFFFFFFFLHYFTHFHPCRMLTFGQCGPIGATSNVCFMDEAALHANLPCNHYLGAGAYHSANSHDRCVCHHSHGRNNWVIMPRVHPQWLFLSAGLALLPLPFQWNRTVHWMTLHIPNRVWYIKVRSSSCTNCFMPNCLNVWNSSLTL